MIGTILSALVVGLIVGALARLIMPGKQNIGVIMTIILGALGSFAGTWLTYSVGYRTPTADGRSSRSSSASSWRSSSSPSTSASRDDAAPRSR